MKALRCKECICWNQEVIFEGATSPAGLDEAEWRKGIGRCERKAPGWEKDLLVMARPFASRIKTRNFYAIWVVTKGEEGCWEGREKPKTEEFGEGYGIWCFSAHKFLVTDSGIIFRANNVEVALSSLGLLLKDGASKADLEVKPIPINYKVAEE